MKGIRLDKFDWVEDGGFQRLKNRFMRTYDMTDVHAGCYIVNYRVQYLCSGCPGLDKCEQVYSAESEET